VPTGNPAGTEVIVMPEPGSKKYDIHRAHRRKDAENRGVPDQHANQEANDELQRDAHWQPRGPRTERGAGPEGERRSERRERRREG
jgi:hypothetical protein